MKNKKMKKKIDWIILIIVIIVQLIALFILGKAIAAKTDLLVEEKHQLIALEERDASLAKLQTDFDLIKEDIGFIDEALPNKEKIIDFINQLEVHASSSGVLTKISFDSQSVVAESADVKSLRFTLNLQGTYFQMVEFIKKIEKMSQVVIVENISIQSPKGIEGQNNAILTMKCYIDSKF